MCAAIDGVDGIGEGEDVFAVGVVVLKSDFDFNVALLAFHEDRRIVEGALAAVEVLDEFSNTTGKTKFSGFFRAFVGERDLETFVEEGVLTQACGEGIVAEDGLFENAGIRMERHSSAGFAGLAGLLQLGGGLAFFIALFPDGTVALNFEFEFIRKRIDDGDADAVETAGDFIGVAIEFTASMKHRENNFSGGTLFGGVHVHGNAAAVVYDGDGIIGVNGYVDFVGEPSHGFVHGVVDHFPDQMVETQFAGGPNIHGGAKADGFQAAEDLNGFRVVLMASCSRDGFFIAHVFSLALFATVPRETNPSRSTGAEKSCVRLHAYQQNRSTTENPPWTVQRKILEARKGVM